eukprot:CAMPEP_0117582078 /NCGR_PEP_ID=MMETSP0784-20121206/66221_1 /TAXON_ID=39447 /ORGANISM="" /LENGTH=164 /DNA_ID=CAMNT_0005382537 /DNA_START=17 /DNA_END=508 /DNA_ORIENTATION=+
MTTSLDLRETVKAVRPNLPVKDGRLQFTLIWPAEEIDRLKMAGGPYSSEVAEKIPRPEKGEGVVETRLPMDEPLTKAAWAQHVKKTRKAKSAEDSTKTLDARKSRETAKDLEAREAMYLKIAKMFTEQGRAQKIRKAEVGEVHSAGGAKRDEISPKQVAPDATE